MMRLTALVACFVALLGFAGAAAQGALIQYHANMDGPSESPTNNSPGVGTTSVDYDDVAHTLHVHVVFSGLQGNTTASHIHAPTAVALAGTAGVATTTPTFAGFPLGVTSGTYDNTLDLTQSSSYNPSYVTANGGTPTSAEAALTSAIAAGKSYLNVHSSVYGGGEIRGFLVPGAIPEPGTGLLVAAFAGAMGLRRRRVAPV